MPEVKPGSITEDGRAGNPESAFTSICSECCAGIVYYQEGDHFTNRWPWTLHRVPDGSKQTCLLSLTSVPRVFMEGCQGSLPSLISPSLIFFPPSMMSLLFVHSTWPFLLYQCPSSILEKLYRLLKSWTCSPETALKCQRGCSYGTWAHHRKT